MLEHINSLIKKTCRKSKGAIDDFKVVNNNINHYFYYLQIIHKSAFFEETGNVASPVRL